MRLPRAILALLAFLIFVTSCSPQQPPEPPPPDWLWVSVWGESKLLAFDEEQLQTGATGAEAALAIGFGTERRPYGFDFDANGDLWVGMQDGELLRYAADDVRTSGTPTPQSELTTGASHVAGVRFAPNGWLWAAVAGKILGWDPVTLAAGGAPGPDVTITSASPYMATYPNDLVFDAEGGLWTVGLDAVLRFAPSQLAADGEVEPDVVIYSDGTSLQSPRGLAFDGNGDLWVSTYVGFTVEKFRQQDLAASGSPAPVVALQPPGTYRMRVAFDADDNMWVSAIFAPGFGPAGYVAMIAPQNRVSSGPAVASAEFSELGSIDVGGAMVFHPRPR